MNLRRTIPAFLTLAALSLAGPALAFNPQPDPPGFGMIGIVSSQTARLSVVFSSPPDGDRTSRLAVVRLQFVDEAGRILSESVQRLMPGQGAHFDYAGARTGRTQIRGVVSVDDPNIRPVLLGTMEVFHTESGQTAFVLPGTFVYFKEVDPAPAKKN